MECLKCNVSDNKSCLKCDGCERSIHTECSGLSATELKVMGLKGSRLLKFYCDDCQAGVRLVPKLIKRLDDLQKEVEKLKTQISNEKFTISDETIFSEIHERQKRTNNIMVFNMPESNGDLVKSKELLKEITKEDVSVISAMRVGKANKNGNRALKLILDKASDVDRVLRAKKDKLKGRSIFINADLTPAQYRHIKQIRDEVEVRKRNGEDVVFKFIRGIPKIVSSSSDEKN